MQQQTGIATCVQLTFVWMTHVHVTMHVESK